MTADLSEIERLQAENARLREALKGLLLAHIGRDQFIALERNGWEWPEDAPDVVSSPVERARAALRGEPTP